jgi:hypothetical protein
MKELGSGAVRWATPAACVNEIITNVLVMKQIGENQFRLIGTRESRLGETICNASFQIVQRETHR